MRIRTLVVVAAAAVSGLAAVPVAHAAATSPTPDPVVTMNAAAPLCVNLEIIDWGICIDNPFPFNRH